MKKFFAKILCLITILSLICSLTVFAEEVPVSINLGGTSVVSPGEEAVLTIDAIINKGYDIQGVQVSFEFSENFPELKDMKFIKNTTGWQNTGITKKNMLAIGNIINEQSQLVAKITFDIPDDVENGTEYIFTPVKAIGATAEQEVPAKLNVESIKIVVVGGKPTEKPEIPADKPEDTKGEDNKNDKDQNSEANNNEKDKNTEVTQKPTNKEENTEEALKWKNPFSDVEESDWFYDGVRFVFENELMSGVDDGVFAPDSTLTRAMLVTILHRLDGLPESFTYDFSDVPRKAWYTKGVEWAATTGIVSGVGDNMFAPDIPVTREQMAVIFYNYSKFKEMDLTADKDLSVYVDKNEASEWATTALEWAVSSGLITGKGNNILDPKGQATRAEASIIIERYAENIIEK